MKSRKLTSKWYQGILLLVAAMAFAAALPEAQSQAVHGSGTTNHVPLWTSSSAIGNSALSQSGGNLVPRQRKWDSLRPEVKLHI